MQSIIKAPRAQGLCRNIRLRPNIHFKHLRFPEWFIFKFNNG